MNPLIVLLTGMLIVFIGLICIVLIVKLMTLICSLFIGKKNQMPRQTQTSIHPHLLKDLLQLLSAERNARSLLSPFLPLSVK